MLVHKIENDPVEFVSTHCAFLAKKVIADGCFFLLTLE